MVMGEGLDPSLEHLLKLGLDAKLPKDRIVRIIDQTRSVLAEWPVLAAQYGVGRETIAYIGSVLDQVK
jgi:serine/threonine-protein kinase HipA